VVVCEAQGNAAPDQLGFPQAPTNPAMNCPPPPGTYLRCVGPSHWDQAVVHASGAFNWHDGNIGVYSPDTTLSYGQIYDIQGWTIAPGEDGTRFTNDATGHGMFVSIDNVSSF
jgi:hypothetical protein